MKLRNASILDISFYPSKHFRRFFTRMFENEMKEYEREES